MSNNKLFRIAAWCALLAALLMVSFFVVFSVAPTSGIGEILAVIGVLVLTPVFYALYIAHRSESAVLSLAGLVLWVPAGILDIASLLNPANTFLFAVDSVVFSLPLLIFGFLACRSAKTPRGLAGMALLSGVLYLIAGVASFIASATIGSLAGLGGLAFMLVWFVWLWRVFHRGNWQQHSPP